METFLYRSVFAVLVLIVFSATLMAKPRSFHEVVDAYFEDHYKAHPTAATLVGFHQYDSQLEDFSVAAHAETRQRLQKYLAQFQAIDPKTLSPSERDDREIMNGG